MPPQGLLIFPLAGAVLGLFGPVVSGAGYFLILGCCAAYFADDLMQRRVKIEDGVLKHGTRAFKLNELQSLGVQYKPGKISPHGMVFTFADGKSLELTLGRLQLRSIEKLLAHIETYYAQCQIDPVLRTLVRCQKVARKILVDDEDALIIEYQGYRKLLDIYNTYTETAHGWLQWGPGLLVLITMPLWTVAVGGSYLAFSKSREATYTLVKILAEGLFQAHMATGQIVSSGTEHLGHFLANPITCVISLVALCWALKYLFELSFQPTAAKVDRNGLELRFAVGRTVMRLAKIEWANVKRVSLVANGEQGKSRWLVRFECGNKEHFDLDLAAITPQDRPRLMKAIERFAPECEIASEFAEAMAPKQERSYTQLWLQSLSATPERSNLQSLSPGATLKDGRYKVVNRLGVGGQSTAYLCTDSYENVSVVLKETIVPVFADASIKEQALKRFEHEAHVLESLHSDHIVKPLDYFFEDHRCFLVLEHVKGKTLRQMVEDDGAIVESQVRALGSQMCKILKYLHEKGIIHRDFTPDNLIVTASGALKLIDFNVAQEVQSRTTGSIAGKHAYLPPEQFRGKATFQSDIYALGATLHYLLTGSDPSPITQSSPRKILQEVSEQMDAVVQKCTALQCGQRADDLDELESMLETGPTPDTGSVINIGQPENEEVVIGTVSDRRRQASR